MRVKQIIAGLLAMMLVSCSSSGVREVTIGKHTWTGENLNVETFRNGDSIPEARTDSAWVRAELAREPAWCFLDNKRENGRKYGRIYNHYAIVDQRGLAPKGWRVPTYDEWLDLFEECGGRRIHVGGHLPGDTLVMLLRLGTGRFNAEDSLSLLRADMNGWRALPGGGRDPSGGFEQGNWMWYWSSTVDSVEEYNSDSVWVISIGSYLACLKNKRAGCYVRLIMD